jgi:hypothetical protein
MSSIKLTGDTSGEITISAPAVAGTNTLTLPATTGSLMTSTFTGDINFDSDTLVVDSTNNRVGIGTTSPAINFETSGSMAVSDTSTASKRLQLDSGASAHTINSANYGSDMMDLNIQAENLIFKTGLIGVAERMRIDSSGNLLCNSTSLGFANQTAVQIQTVSTGLISIQHLNTETNGSAYMWFTHNGGAIGSITQNGTTGISYNVNSDYRLKENVSYTWDATSRLKQLKPARFNFIADTDRTVDGFIAHEVSDIVPEAITGTKDAMETYTDDDGEEQTREKYQGIDQSKLVPLLVKTCQEQQTIIEDLQTRITALENN